jgi:hypothetical protein
MAGFVPAISLRKVHILLIEITGTSPVMTNAQRSIMAFLM